MEIQYAFLLLQGPHVLLPVGAQIQAAYLGIVEGGRIEHPSLILEKRARMKILLFDMDKDVPVKTVHTILKKARQFYT